MTDQKKEIDTRLVYGFLDAGKTTYIRECIRTDHFCKRGRTLIICFEQGEEDYSKEEFNAKNIFLVFYESGDVKTFCEDKISEYRPDRIYVEMNAMIPELKKQFPECMKITFSMALIDWSTMPLYYVNFLKLIQQMVSESDQVVFRGCPSADLLAPYSQAFRLMNPKASYLRQDPMGYHERAFDMFLPFSLEDSEIMVNESRFLPLWLDALDHPEHYDGKKISFRDPLELRRKEGGLYSCGRVVMTCCMADLQFMAFDIENVEHARGVESIDESDLPDGSWITVDALARVVSESYGQRKIRLSAESIGLVQPPKDLILDGRRQNMDDQSK